MHIPIEKKKDIILKLFEYIRECWEVYMPLEGDNEFIILKTVCSNCGANWFVDEKECFTCKARYLRVIICHHCDTVIAEENIRKCPNCGEKVDIRKCLNCSRSGDGQFVPITFCTKCGNRKNKLEFKIIKL